MQNGQMEVGIEEPTASQARPSRPPIILDTENEGGNRNRGTVTRNPRIVAISRISNILDGLDDESRGRAVRFIAEEYAEFLGD